MEKHLNWQTVPLEVPCEEWMTPVLLIAGWLGDPGFRMMRWLKPEFRMGIDCIHFGWELEGVHGGDEGVCVEDGGWSGGGVEAIAGGSSVVHGVHASEGAAGVVWGVERVAGVVDSLSDGCGGGVAVGDFRAKQRPQAWELPAQLVFLCGGERGWWSKLDSLVVQASAEGVAEEGDPHGGRSMGEWNAGACGRAALGADHGERRGESGDRSCEGGGAGGDGREAGAGASGGDGEAELSDDEKQALKIYAVGGTCRLWSAGG